MIVEKIYEIEKIQRTIIDSGLENKSIKKEYKNLDGLLKFYIINYIYKENKIDVSDKYDLNKYISREKTSKLTLNIVFVISIILGLAQTLSIYPEILTTAVFLKIVSILILILVINYIFNVLPNKLKNLDIIEDIVKQPQFVDIFLDDIKYRKNSKRLYNSYMKLLKNIGKIHSQVRIELDIEANNARKLISELELELKKLPTISKELQELEFLKYEVVPMLYKEKTYLNSENVKYIVDESKIVLRTINRELQQYDFYILEIDNQQESNFIIKYSELGNLTFNKTISINKDIWNNQLYAKIFYTKAIDKKELDKLDKQINKAN